MDDSKIFFLFLNDSICRGPLLEPSRQDGSNAESQFSSYGEIWLIIPKISLSPLLIWRTV